MEKDVVCGMQVDDATATNTSEYQGRAFYFCSPACKAKFDQKPEAHASKGARIHQHESAIFLPTIPKPKR